MRSGRPLSLIFYGDLIDSAVVKLRKFSVFEHEVVAMSVSKKPMVLVILDGYGYREDQQDNAIYSAKTPVMDALWAKRPHTLIDASGLEVGLPDRQMGNSEVGHVNLGAGRIVYQDLTRLDVEIKERTFFANPVLTGAVDKAVAAGKAVHIMGLMSPGGVHSHEDHIMAMVELAAERGADKIYLHAFLDGRDTPPRSAEKTLAKFEDKFAALGKGRVASIIGRYYAMDRDNRWDRVEQAYDLMTLAKGEFQADTAVAGLQAAYARDENDEFVKATVIRAAGQADAAMEDGDALIFMNFRADRAREITRAFVNADFDGFARKKVVNLDFVMLTEYAADIKVACAYPPASLNTFGEWMAKNDKTQLRISETEKYAHVTFFFNGGVEEPFKGEERILINSPKVATYDLQPEMSSAELTEKLVAAIKGGQFDTIICNYPNGDMVGHTGVMEAAVKAVEALDHCIDQVSKAVESVGGQLLITADHGNAEQMRDPATGQAHTAHTNLPVPLIYVGDKNVKAVNGGKLSDIAPTMLTLMGMEIPQEMTGKPLFIVE
jgi:2,3-bisphosphoglycerate-independent phosphoglycerate mutase